jgi:hypothetical protein
MLFRNYHQPAEGTGLLRACAARRVRDAPRRNRAPREELPPADAPARLQPDERDGLAIAGPHPQRSRPAGPASRTGRSLCVFPNPVGSVILIFLNFYLIQHCIISRPINSTVWKDAGFVPQSTYI